MVDTTESITSGLHLLKPPDNPYRQRTHTPEWQFMDDGLLIDLARELGKCETCYGFGSIEKGLQVELEGMIMSYYPPTLRILHLRPRNHMKEMCSWYNSKSPTSSPTDSPSASPTAQPSASPTKQGQTHPPTFEPTVSPTPYVCCRTTWCYFCLCTLLPSSFCWL